MQILSAIDAVSPAIARTRLVLFTPFRAGRTWKLAATGYLTKAGLVFIPFPLFYFFVLPSITHQIGRGAVIASVIGVLLATAFIAWLFHLCTRLQFAFFDIVLNRGEFVAPAWRKYGPQSRMWTAVKVAFGTVATLVMAIPVAAYLRHLVPLMGSLKPNQPPPPEFFTAFFLGYGIILFGCGSVFLASAFFSDFVVPSLTLENTTLGEAFRRFFLLIRREPGQVAAYFFVKLGLGIAGYMSGIIALEFVILFVLLIVGGIAFAFGLLLHAIGVPNEVLTGLAIFLGFLSYVAVIFYGAMLMVGTLITFLQAYTLYFLGGRYPLLGDLLQHSTPPTAPPFPDPYPYAYVAPPSAPPTP